MDIGELKAFYRVMTGPPRYEVGPPWANRAGLTLGRIALHQLAYSMRTQPIDRDVAGEYLARLEADGVVTIPDFLPAPVFAEMQRAFDSLLASSRAKSTHDMAGSGVDWRTAVADDTSTAGAAVMRTLGRHPMITAMASGLMRRPVRRDPHVAAQHLAVAASGADRGDTNSALHADRFFPTLKAFLLLNEGNEANGTFIYCRRSHHLSMPRLRFEYERSIADAEHRRLIGERLWLYEGEDLAYRKVPITEETLRSMGVREESIGGPANTLILTNNQGFHKRGTMQPGTERKQFRIIFHQLEEPRYAETLRSVVRSSRSMLPGEGS